MKFIGANGKQQVVYESRTHSGIRGLFTGGCLAMSLKADEDAKTVAERCGFLFQPTKTNGE